MTTTFKLTAAVLCGLTLAACGGGSNSSGPPPVVSYTVTPSVSGSGGTIGPAAATPVTSGATISFTLAPASGYIAGSVGGTCGGTLVGNTYTTAAVTADCTVVATFKALTFSYEAMSPVLDPADRTGSFLAFLNREGSKGYRYLTEWNHSFDWTLPPPPPGSMIFVNDGTGQSYTYEMMFVPATAADFVVQANAEGAKGYRFQGQLGWMACLVVSDNVPAVPNCPTLLYRKDSGSSATYSYATDAKPGNVADFLQQANKWGQSGYLGYSTTGYTDGALLYVKNNASSAIYSYEAPAWPSSTAPQLAQYNAANQLAQYNSEGARGYLPRFLIGFGNDSFSVYARDQTQTAVYEYLPSTVTPTPPAPSPDAIAIVSLFDDYYGAWGSDLTAFLNEANNYGAQGYALFGGVAVNTYVKVGNCSGDVLCRSLDWPTN